MFQIENLEYTEKLCALLITPFKQNITILPSPLTKAVPTGDKTTPYHFLKGNTVVKTLNFGIRFSGNSKPTDLNPFNPPITAMSL